ncbi:MAG: peptidoglycan-binding domain-containing protein [Xanthobacteraceae bacterium]
MTRIMLALVAGAALVLPAAAQSPQTQAEPSPAANQAKPQQGSQSGMSGNQSGSQQKMSAKDLNESQIRALQQALNKKGFSSGDVDGVWGPETRDALQNFQKEQGITAETDQIDQQTIQALDLNTSSSFSRETTGMGGGDQPSRDSQGQMNKPADGSNPPGARPMDGSSGQSGGSQAR